MNFVTWSLFYLETIPISIVKNLVQIFRITDDAFIELGHISLTEGGATYSKFGANRLIFRNIHSIPKQSDLDIANTHVSSLFTIFVS